MINEGEQSMESKRPSIEEVRGLRETLKSKLELAEIQKEEHVQKMLVELEDLASEREQNKQLQSEAQETLSYYIEMETKERLDEEDIENLEHVKALVFGLEVQIKTIDESVAEIKANPDVARRLKEKEEAGLELKNKERIEKQVELKKKLWGELAMLGEDIKALGGKQFLLNKQIKDAKDAEINARKRVDQLAEDEIGKLGTNNAVKYELRPYDHGSDYSAYFEKLERLRSKLRFYQFAAKLAIDDILSQKELFGQIGEAHRASLNLWKSLKPNYAEIEEEAKALGVRYGKILYEPRELDYNHLDELSKRFRNLLRSFADVNRPDPDDSTGKRNVGQYPGWGYAQSDPKNKALYEIMYKVNEHLSD